MVVPGRTLAAQPMVGLGLRSLVRVVFGDKSRRLRGA